MPYTQMDMNNYYRDEENGIYGLPIKLIYETASKSNQLLSTKKKIKKLVQKVNYVTNKSK